jgi:hypothetical protein
VRFNDRSLIAFLSLLGALFSLGPAWAHRRGVLFGSNDFVAFYSGGRLAGTFHLYNGERIRQVQAERVGVTGEAWLFIRPPYYAALFWPLARLPYRAAYAVWQVVCLGAVVAFVMLWRRTPPGATALSVCLSLPLGLSLMNGQDLPLLLLWIALALRAHQKGQPALAGMLLALCAAKPHLLVLLPLLIAAQRLWRLAWGLAAGGALLAGLSFILAGPGWPREMAAVLADPAVHPHLAMMPNLRGVSAAAQWALAPAVAAAVWWVARRRSFYYGLAATLAGSLLVSFHAYLPDCTLLLPAALIVATEAARWPARWMAIALLTPLPYFLAPALLAGPVLLLLAAMAFEKPPPVRTGCSPCRSPTARSSWSRPSD